jgi:hypothetical protein
MDIGNNEMKIKINKKVFIGVLISFMIFFISGYFLGQYNFKHSEQNNYWTPFFENEACIEGCRIMNEIKSNNLSYDLMIEDHNHCVNKCSSYFGGTN